MNAEQTEMFGMAMRAFEVMTARERVSVLMIFATLQYPNLADRFHEAVYRVIRRGDAS